MAKRIAITLAAFLVLAGCVPQPDNEKLTQDMVVYTSYDQGVDFGSYHTFAIREDTIGLVSNQYSQDYLIQSQYDLVNPAINAVKNGLTTRGYSQVDIDQDPDLGVYIFVLDNFNVFQQVVYPSYYPGSYYGGYSGYYGYYYPYVQTYTSNYGTLVIELVDFKNSTNNESAVVWNTYIGDLYDTPDYLSKAVEAITQSFDQSQYLGTN